MERVRQRDYANHLGVINDTVGFCNSIRLHSKLGNLSPNAFKRESTSKNLSSFPELLDHHTQLMAVIVCLRYTIPDKLCRT